MKGIEKVHIGLILALIFCLLLTACSTAQTETLDQSVKTQTETASDSEEEDPNSVAYKNRKKVEEAAKAAEKVRADTACADEVSSADACTGSSAAASSGAAVNAPAGDAKASSAQFDPASVPAYSGNPVCVVNNNTLYFSDSDLTTTAFETYSPLDKLGRCGVAYANICKEIMPTEPRGTIGSVKPSGWHTVKYNGVVDGNYLYNRCHLIAYELAGENANTKNLITGTRYMNVQGMLPYENDTAAYVERTGHHVLYRVTPIFEGSNLVASGVLMEARSVEDNNFYFCVYAYNVQPGIWIDYATGDSALSKIAEGQSGAASNAGTAGSRQALINQGYQPCKRCNP